MVEWLTVGWSKIPLARDSFLLLMTRTMNESMVGKAGRMIQKEEESKGGRRSRNPARSGLYFW
jgi:hypothetical protein